MGKLSRLLLAACLEGTKILLLSSDCNGSLKELR